MLVSLLMKTLITSLINHAVRPFALLPFPCSATKDLVPRLYSATRNAATARGQSACRSWPLGPSYWGELAESVVEAGRRD